MNPSGLDVTAPRLSWSLASSERGQKQTAFQVLAASSAEKLNADPADIWDSGKRISDQTLGIVYDGKPLRSRMEVWWKVRI